MSEEENNNIYEFLKQLLSPEEFELLKEIIKNKGEVDQKNV